MRATLYQESTARASPRRRADGLALALLAALLALSCKQPPEAAAPLAFAPLPAKEPAQAELPRGRSIHYSLLTRFAPDTLPGFTSGPLAASTSRFGKVAVTEVERTYLAGERRLELRIVDSNINSAGKAPTASGPYEDEQRVGRPLTAASSVGYVEFEKASGRAHADLLIAGRLLLSVAQEQAEGTGSLERFCAALDVAGMAELVRQQGPRR